MGGLLEARGLQNEVVFMGFPERHLQLRLESLASCLALIGLAAAWCITLPTLLMGEEAAGPAKLTYTRLLKGSAPEYLAVAVDTRGEGHFEGRKADEPPRPRALKLSEATTRRLFDLAASLNYFQSIDLESHKKVANLGLKTLTYQREGQNNRAEFNYTLRREAQELVELFEGVATVQQHIAALEHAMKYDHLSLPNELLQIRADLDNKALIDPQLMIPALEQIVRNRRFLNLAQIRAQKILARLQGSN